MSTHSRPREKRTLHFDLSHAHPAADHTLHLGVKRVPLKAHDPESRKRFRTAPSVLSHVADEELTHYVEDLDFPSDSVQSFYVTHPGKDPGGPPRLSAFGIHVPRKTLEGRARGVHVAGSLYASKAKRLGLTGSPPPQPYHEPDLADYHDMSEAAKAIVFHHPEIICLDPDVAAQALALVENTRSFQALVDNLKRQGTAQGPDSDYEGFSNGEYMKDGAGQKLPDHKGGYRWRYVHTPETREAMKPVVQQALLAIRNDPSMEKKSFVTVFGKHNVLDAPPARAMRAAQVSSEPYSYKLDDPDWKSGRRLKLEPEPKGRQINLKVENCYYRFIGVFARYLKYDQGGALVPLSLAEALTGYKKKPQDGDHTQYLGKVDDRARIMGIPTEQQAEAEFQIDLPEKANAVDILCGGMGLGGFTPWDEYAHYPGALLTGVLNLGIPSFFLTFGVGADKLIQSDAKKLMTALGSWIVETFVGLIDRQALFGGDYAQDKMSTGWAWDILTSVIKEAPAVMLDLIAWAAEASAEEALESSIPLIGQIWEAISVATSLLELAETVAGIVSSPWVIPARITSTMNINVQVKPDKDNSTYPQSATQYKIVAHLTDTLKWDSGWVEIHSGQYDPARGKYLGYTFHSVPSGGQVEVTVQFIAGDGWVAGYGTSGKVDNLVPEGKESLDLDFHIKENPPPLTPSTEYKHMKKLGIDKSGAHVWIDGPQAPAATITSLGGNGAVTLEDVGNAQITYNMHPGPGGGPNVSVLGYSYRAKSPTLAECGSGGAASTPLYTMQNIQLGTARPDELLKVLRCGFAPPIMVSYDLLAPADGGHFVVAMADEGNGQSHYHVRKLNLGRAGDIDLGKLPSWGRFTSQKITRIAAHGSEFLLALSPDNEMVEILRLPKLPYQSDALATYATQVGKQGERVGLLHGARAMAVTGDGNAFLVLEETNDRIQAFNTNGVPVLYFGDQASVPLRQWPEDKDRALTYLDMCLEYGGYLYVLSYENAGETPDQYRLDLYDPTGKKLARTRGLAAAKLTVDNWRTVYSLNFELLVGPNQRPEPSISVWATSG